MLTESLEYVVTHARHGSLPTLKLLEFLNMLIEADNPSFASWIYRDWINNRQKAITISRAEHYALNIFRDAIMKYFPDMPDVPKIAKGMTVLVDGKNVEYNDITDENFMDIFDKCRPHSLCMMYGPEVAWSLYTSIGYIVRNEIPGDIVECGVWNGGSILLIALTLIQFGDIGRKLYLYDTFDGMAKPEDIDRTFNGDPAIFAWEEHQRKGPDGPKWGFGGHLEDVKQIVYSSGYPIENIIFVKGFVENTLSITKPEVISLLHLDTDFYSSTHCEMIECYPLLSVGGILNVDDYYLFQGSRFAVDNYINENKLPLYINRVGGVGVGVKIKK
jgi:hypothetical protein